MIKQPLTMTARYLSTWILITALLCLSLSPSTSAEERNLRPRNNDAFLEALAKFSTIGNREKINCIPRDAVLSLSRQLDSLADQVDENKIELENDLITDHEFVRRIYLDIAGRIPTYDEVNTFLKSAAPEKRLDLIDRLLDSDAYVSHQFNYFADLFRIQSRSRIGPNQPFSNFVKDSLKENKPYDEFIHEMLVAEGPYFKRGNGATGYLLRDYSMPEAAMSNTIRIFLGTRIECAQCHNHPTDKWTQRQYFEMVAFFGGMAYRIDKTESEYASELDKVAKNPKYPDSTRRFMRQAIIPLRFGLRGSGQGMARLPKGYQYADGDEHEVVFAKTMYDNIQTKNPTLPDNVSPPEESMAPERTQHRIAKASHIDSRKILADWMTSAENERFATVIANRLWKQVMGEGIIEPVDNITDDSMAAQPELLTILSDAIVSLDFDVKQLLRAIYYSKRYQTTSVRLTETKQQSGTVRPQMRRMSAEQVWDSLLALTIDNVDKPRQILQPLPNYLGRTDLADSYDELVKKTPEQLEKIVLDNIAKRDGDPEYPRHVFRLDARPGINRRHLIYKELAGNELARASDMLSPMPPDHLLRDFGQSDREAVNNGNREISVAQILQFLNGFAENQLVNNPHSQINLNLQSAKSDREKIEVAFLSILGRKPTIKERKQWTLDFERFGSEAAGDLVWTLVNSTEFLFIK